MNFIKIFIFLLIVQIGVAQVRTVTQTGVRRSMIRGDATTLTWNVSGNCSSDSLLFIVKDKNGDAVLRTSTGGGISASYSKPNTTITATIYAATTENFVAQNYLYDITNVTDSITLIMGSLTVTADISNLGDTVIASVPYYTVALDTPNYANTFIIGQDSTDIWYRRTTAETRTILGIDTLTGGTTIPDSVVFESELDNYVDKTSTENIGGVKTFTGSKTVFSGDII